MGPGPPDYRDSTAAPDDVETGAAATAQGDANARRENHWLVVPLCRPVLSSPHGVMLAGQHAVLMLQLAVLAYGPGTASTVWPEAPGLGVLVGVLPLTVSRSGYLSMVSLTLTAAAAFVAADVHVLLRLPPRTRVHPVLAYGLAAGSTVLALPIAGMLLSVFLCNQDLRGNVSLLSTTQQLCWDTTHSSLTVLTALLLPPYLGSPPAWPECTATC